MLKTSAILRTLFVVVTVSITTSCNTKTRFENDLLAQNILIPYILKDMKDIQAFVTETESQINRLTIQSQHLNEEYRSISDKSNKRNGLMSDVKKVTIRGRINAVFSDLSEIYSKIDSQASYFEIQLSAEQKLAFKSVTNQLKDKIDVVMISLNPVDEESKKGKIIIF